MSYFRHLCWALAFACASAFGQSAFQPVGNTCTFTANTSGNVPTAVQCPTSQGTAQQYVLTNSGANDAFVGWGQTAAIAAINAVIPTSTTQFGYWLMSRTQITVSAPANAYFTGITGSGTSVVYVTPGTGW